MSSFSLNHENLNRLLEERGRLRYIDGCTDSLLIAPLPWRNATRIMVVIYSKWLILLSIKHLPFSRYMRQQIRIRDFVVQ